AKFLFDSGISLCLTETIPDHIDTIAETIQRHASKFDFVFTSGGIGPTHDDLTYEAVAKAFNCPLKLYEDAQKHYREITGRDLAGARLKMATLPDKAEVLWTENLWVPTVYIHPVYVLPGIPELFTAMLHSLKPRFDFPPFERQLLYTNQPEAEIAFKLEEVQKRFPEVEIGSYPQKMPDGFRVMISIEGPKDNGVQQVAEEIRKFI
ncbi:MAG: competence/damage-inducible protein A, partial [Deltaproteobacteria bacterium]|nr:competence/damage-inducible protein A [Deltaproteobacteria bacterium]